MSQDNEFYDEPNSDDAEAFLSAYVQFDERQDVLASLDLLMLIAPLLNECPAYWK